MSASRPPAARWCGPALALTAAAGAALIIAPPLLVDAGRHDEAALARLFFAPVCHQIPERSFQLFETPLAVCARCTGLYCGALLVFVAGALGARARRPMRHAGAVLAAAAAPSLAGWLLSAIGLIQDTAFLRALAGAVLGAGIGIILIAAFESLCEELASPHGSRFVNRPASVVSRKSVAAPRPPKFPTRHTSSSPSQITGG